jgi:hypothetical protein
MWLAATNQAVDGINAEAFKRLATAGKPYYRIWAEHRPSDSRKQSPTSDELVKLLKRQKSRNDGIQRPYVDLAIGTRTRCTDNLATQVTDRTSIFCILSIPFINVYSDLKLVYVVTYGSIRQSGIYNGALGTVYGFGFLGAAPNQRIPTLAEAAARRNDGSGIPVVLVQMDGGVKPDGSTYGYTGDSCLADVPRVVPFCAVQSRTKLMGKFYRWQLPLEPAHASTIHLAQGLTCTDGVVIQPPRGAGQSMGLVYVAISRATKLANVHLLGGLTRQHFDGHRPTRQLVQAEYARLNKLNS